MIKLKILSVKGKILIEKISENIFAKQLKQRKLNSNKLSSLIPNQKMEEIYKKNIRK